jgi:hypothetical protein
MSNFTFGCDPEVFLKKSGKPASAFGLLPGDKKNPHKTPGGAIQVDGMAAEFNIDPVPQTDFELFNARVIQQIKEIRNRVPGYNLNVAPVQDFGEEFLASQPDEAKELGCDPDFNAYTLEANPGPDGERPFRTGAGHVHIGWGADIPIDNEEHIEICANFVKIMDATVGMFMTMIDNEPRRRELYGKAGAFRPKPYGVEYRTPSNVWIKNRDNRRAVFALMNYATWLATTKFPAQTNFDVIQIYINEGNALAAYEMLIFTMRNYYPYDNGHYNWLRGYLQQLGEGLKIKEAA